MKTMYYVNENLPELYRIFEDGTRHGFVRMDLNENPLGLPEEFVRKVFDSIPAQAISMYPEQGPLLERLSAFLGVERNQLCLTNGSSEAVRYAIEAFTRPGGKYVSVTPSFAMYAVFGQMYGRQHIPLGYNADLTFDVDKIIEAIQPDVDLIFICNPNNPVGDVYSEEDMARILAAAKANEVTVVIDEAYHYFYPKTFLHFALENDHVFVLRTFSKMFSLAGCRLGFVVGKAEGVNLIQKLCSPYNVNTLSLYFAKAILDEPGMLDSLIAAQLEGKSYLVDQLKQRGYAFSAKEGNFLFIQPKTDADVLVERMKGEKKILIKAYRGIGALGKCLRVSTGQKAVMETFLQAMDELDR